MAELSFRIEIDAPADRVAAFFVPQRMAYWYGYDIEAQFEIAHDAPEFHVGQKVRIIGRVIGKEFSLTTVVMRYEPGRVLEWRFKDAYDVRGMQVWDIEPAGKKTGVFMRDVYTFPGRLGRFFDAILMRYGVARRDLRWLARLKKLAERS